MSILIGAQSKVLVQGITGREGHFHTEQMIQYGTHVVGGVTPAGAGKLFLACPYSIRWNRPSAQPAPTSAWSLSLRHRRRTRLAKPPQRASGLW